MVGEVDAMIATSAIFEEATLIHEFDWAHAPALKATIDLGLSFGNVGEDGKTIFIGNIFNVL